MFVLLVTSVSASLTDDLFSYWKYDENTGLNSYDEISSYNGTIAGATWTTGKLNYCLDYDGTNNDYTLLPTGHNPISNTNQPFTISLWFNSETNDVFQRLYEFNSGTQFVIQKMGTGQGCDNCMRFLVYNSGVKVDVQGTAITSSGWHYYVIQNTGSGKYEMFIDDVSVGTHNTTYNLPISGTGYVGRGSPAVTEYFDGQIDELAFWNRTLSSVELTALYNLGVGLSYPFTQDYFIISSNIDDYNISMVSNETKTYTGNSTSYITDLEVIDERLWNITLSAYNYLPLTFTNFNISTNNTLNATFLPNNTITFTAKDVLNNSITDFYVGYDLFLTDDTDYTTTSTSYAEIETYLKVSSFGLDSSDHLFVNNITNQIKTSNVAYTSSCYYEFNYKDATISNSTVQTTSSTSYVTKTYTNPYPSKELDAIILYCKRSSGTTYTDNQNITYYKGIDYNETQYFLNQEYIFHFIKENYYLKDLNYTFNFTGTTILNFTDVYQAILNITQLELPYNTSLDNFSGYVYQIDNDVNISFSTTTNTTTVNLLQGYNYTIYINPTSVYSSYEEDIYVNDTTYNLTAYVYKVSSIYINFYDELNLSLMNFTNVTLEVISDSYGYETSTLNGTIYLVNLTPQEYILRYTAENYTSRERIVTVIGTDYEVLSLYLVSNSSTDHQDITFNVRDYTDNNIESADVKALKYDITTGNYIFIDSCRTNFLGTCTMNLAFNTEYYKFQVEYNSETMLTTNPTYITSTSYVLRIDVGEDYTSDYFNFMDIDASLVFNNDTNNFRLTYNDNNDLASNFCLYVYSFRYLEQTLVGSSCSQTSSGTVLVPITPLNGTYYVAYAYYNNPAIFLISASYEVPISESFSSQGIFLQILLTITFAVASLKFIEFTGLSVSLSLILGKLINLNTLGWEAILGILVASIVVIFVLRRDK